MSTCLFQKYGSGGQLETTGAYCLLSVNIFNQKIYFFIWFWIWFMIAISAYSLIATAAVYFIPILRRVLFAYRYREAWVRVHREVATKDKKMKPLIRNRPDGDRRVRRRSEASERMSTKSSTLTNLTRDDNMENEGVEIELTAEQYFVFSQLGRHVDTDTLVMLMSNIIEERTEKSGVKLYKHVSIRIVSSHEDINDVEDDGDTDEHESEKSNSRV